MGTQPWDELDAMPDDSEPKRLWTAAQTSDTLEFKLERGIVEPGRSFSRDALDVVTDRIGAWIEAQVLVRWRATGEPPTAMTVIVSAQVQ